MTLDEFQKENEKLFKELKQRMIELLQQGIKYELDQELMLVIINREIEKIGKE